MQKLFSEFPSTTSAQWKEQLVKDLKGIDYNTLVWKTNSGIEVQPFYTKENVQVDPEPVFKTHDWAICESITVTDEKAANALALNALQNGASGLIFEITQKTNYAVLLKDILLEHIYSLFKVTADQESELHSFLATVTCGNECFVENDTLLRTNSSFNTSGSTLSINTSIYQEAGSNTVHEIAFSLAHLNEYLNNASSSGTLPAIKKIHVSISVGGDFFMEIAKIRALRKSLIFLLRQYQVEPAIHIHAQTTAINKSVIDSYTNMLRSTTETMSASIGGANSILVLPFDSAFNGGSDFSSRMARNQQLILKDESYLNVVADIAAGSYYIENITETLCEKAWEQFKLIEAKGGLKACLASNYIQEIISKDAELLLAQFKEGKLILVGVNKFQNKNEEKKMKDVRHKIQADASLYSGIKAIKLSESFEDQLAN